MSGRLILFVIKKNKNNRTDDFEEIKKDAQSEIEHGVILLFTKPSHAVYQYANEDKKAPAHPCELLIVSYLWNVF